MGVEAMFTRSGFLLSQYKYIKDIRKTFGMTGPKEITTFMESNPVLKIKDCLGSKNETEFREAIGSLQYLSLTRPDLSFTVNELVLFLHVLTQNHCIAFKRMMHYLNGVLWLVLT